MLPAHAVPAGNGRAPATATPTTPAAAATGDAAIRQAAEAWRARNPARLAAAVAGSRNHVLAPWVDYWQLALGIDQASSEQVDAFLARHPGSLPAERLRGDWLRALARHQQWASLHAATSTRPPEDPELLCLTIEAAARAGKPASAASVAPMLRLARALPEACAALIAPLAASGVIESEMLWERIHVLLDSGSLAGLQQTSQWLDRNQRPDSGDLALAWSSPLAFLRRHRPFTEVRADRELHVVALTRLARGDPFAAGQWFDSASAARLTTSDRAFVSAQIGAALARLHAPGAVSWFDNVEGISVSEDIAAWRVRAALRDEDWPRVRTAIDRMPTPARSDSAWIYWSARAHQALNAPQQAQAELARIAGEHDFYGTLAAEELGRPARLPDRPAVPSALELEAAASNPSLVRAAALFRLGLRSEGVSEWNWGLRGLDDPQLIAAADYARSLGLWDRAINTAERTRAAHDFGLRFLAPYQAVFEQHARDQSLVSSWVLGVARQESRFIADIRSSAGAVGLMQLMPATARLVARRIGLAAPDLTDPQTNVRLGTSYLRQVLDRLDSQPLLASAGYNAGPGRAERWRAARPLEGAIYAETIPFNETRDYVKRVLANTVWYAQVLGQPAISLKSLLATVPPRAATAVASEAAAR